MGVDKEAAVKPLVQRNASDSSWRVACSQPTSASDQHFLEITDLLLEQVQLNSTHLFRADILYDSASQLDTLMEKEARYGRTAPEVKSPPDSYSSLCVPAAPSFEGYQHQRTVVRRLIPRKPQLDRPLEQSCYMYCCDPSVRTDSKPTEVLVVYRPHCQSEDEMPWYHPKVYMLAYLYSKHQLDAAVVSVHYFPFSTTSSPLPDRLERTFRSLLKTMLRLLVIPAMKEGPVRPTSNDILTMELTPAALKDTLLPQHIVQDTYTNLKQKYASYLISQWVESTEPSKHVFEDLSIAAFLIELWKTMYDKTKFPGFVDMACGNGVLVYILVKEGYPGYGFDAKRRKTWEILGIDSLLHEQVCIPKPFLDTSSDVDTLKPNLSIHDGVFPRGTFIVSNHADELTCWTPIFSVLSCPEAPLPFLTIPCCSHALDGSRHRYTLKEIARSRSAADYSSISTNDKEPVEDQPATGDLKALRAAKQKLTSDDKSMYGCLTRKTAALAEELGCDTELTLMRIPSTRNIGIVGNRKQDIVAPLETMSLQTETPGTGATRRIQALIERECSISGGLEKSARAWIEKTRKLQEGQGRGKVNWNSHMSKQPNENVDTDDTPPM